MKAARRDFLRKVLLGGAASAALAGGAAAKGGKDGATAAAQRGYRESDHIRRYYQRARAV